jgi:hypothetical protein
MLPMTTHFFSHAGLAALAAGALATLSPQAGHAEQLTLFDVTFDFTWEDAINASPSKSHYYVKSDKLNAQRPTNWMAPVDYRAGKVHIYLEVLEKPAGGQKQGWALCYVGGGSYGCPYSKYYTEKGVYESDVDMTAFYNNATIDWTKGITEVDLVYTINDSGSGHVHFFPDLKDKTTPTKVRIAMVQVSKGSTYDPSTLPGTIGAGGAGGTGGSGSTAGAGGMGGVANGGAGSGSAGAGGAVTGGAAGLTEAGMGGKATTDTAGMGGTATSSPVTGGATSLGGTSSSVSGTASIGALLENSSDDGGCSFGKRPAGAEPGWFSLAALVVLGRSRRRKTVIAMS